MGLALALALVSVLLAAAAFRSARRAEAAATRAVESARRSLALRAHPQRIVFDSSQVTDDQIGEWLRRELRKQGVFNYR